MNTSSRVPGVSRNSGWRAVDLEIASRRASQQPVQTPHRQPTDRETGTFHLAA
jgi:hypothetical protein